MFNSSITVLLTINFTVLTILFWLLTLVELLLNKNTDNETKTDVYECGFNSINKTTFPVTINTITLLMFVIIYEVELILLTPFLLNISIGLGGLTVHFLSIFIVVILTLYVDIWYKKIYWIY